MGSARRATALCAVAVAVLGVVASASTAADASTRPNSTSMPALHLQQKHQVQTPGSLRGHGNLGGAGHRGCHVYYHAQNHPGLTEVRSIRKPLDTDDELFAFKVLHLDPAKRYFFKLRCGTPRRTVAADSDRPDQPLRNPDLHTEGDPAFTGVFRPGTIRVYGYTGHDGHLVCSVWDHVGGHPKLTLLGRREAFKADNEQFSFYLHDLKLKKKYYVKLRCGTPLHTVASSSSFPTQPTN